MIALEMDRHVTLGALRDRRAEMPQVIPSCFAQPGILLK